MPAWTPPPSPDLHLVRTRDGYDIKLGDQRHPAPDGRLPSFHTVRLICFDRFHKALYPMPESKWRTIRQTLIIPESEATSA